MNVERKGATESSQVERGGTWGTWEEGGGYTGDEYGVQIVYMGNFPLLTILWITGLQSIKRSEQYKDFAFTSFCQQST